MSNHQAQGGVELMDAACSSGSPATERDEIEYDAKRRDVDPADSTRGESSAQRQAEENPEVRGQATDRAEEDVTTKLRRKIYEAGLGDVRVPELGSMSGCSACEDIDSSSDDDDLCSDSSDDDSDGSSYNPLASGVVPPALPDIQLRVPMEDEEDVRRVRNALLIKGVLEVSCDEARQIVTVTGIVPPSRLLKKVRKVKREARVISTVSPFAAFINPHFRSSSFVLEDDESDSPRPGAIDIPSPHPIPNFVVHQQRPRPTFQRYTFHNDPHSPYLRTFSPSDFSPKTSHSRNGCSSLDDGFFHDDEVMSF